MTKLHESHTKDRFTHMIVSVLKQIKSWTCVNPEQTWTSGYENVTTSAKYFIGRMINEIQILRKAHRLSAVCVCSLEIHFSYLWSHTQTHRHTNIFPHGKVALSHLDNKEFLSLFSTTLSLWAVCWPHLTSSLGRHQNKTKHLGCSS